MAALQPFNKLRTFPVNTAEKFKSKMDPDLFSFFKQYYSQYSTVVRLGSSLQLAALGNMLSAAQRAEDNWKNIARAEGGSYGL